MKWSRATILTLVLLSAPIRAVEIAPEAVRWVELGTGCENSRSIAEQIFAHSPWAEPSGWVDGEPRPRFDDGVLETLPDESRVFSVVVNQGSGSCPGSDAFYVRVEEQVCEFVFSGLRDVEFLVNEPKLNDRYMLEQGSCATGGTPWRLTVDVERYYWRDGAYQLAYTTRSEGDEGSAEATSETRWAESERAAYEAAFTAAKRN